MHVLALTRLVKFSSQIAKKQIREGIKVFMRKRKNQRAFLWLVSVGKTKPRVSNKVQGLFLAKLNAKAVWWFYGHRADNQ